MMSRHFRLSSELAGAIAKNFPTCQKSAFCARQFLQSIRYRYIYIYIYIYISLLLKLDYCLFVYIYIYTVEPVYNGHPRDWTKLAVIHRWPLYIGDCLNPQKVST